jgi:hypothetical protein
MLVSLLLAATTQASGENRTSNFVPMAQKAQASPDSQRDQGSSALSPASSHVSHGITDLSSFQQFIKEQKLQPVAKDFALQHSAVAGARNDAIDKAVDEAREKMKKQIDALLDAIKDAYPNGSQELHLAFTKSSHNEVQKMADSLKPKFTPEQIKQLKDDAAAARLIANQAEGLIASNKKALIQLAEENSIDLSVPLDPVKIKFLKDNSSSLAADPGLDANAKKRFREAEVDMFADFISADIKAKAAEAAVPAGAVMPTASSSV